MSKTIDERVVEMRFDNKQFESNVQTSLSTIEKSPMNMAMRDRLTFRNWLSQTVRKDCQFIRHSKLFQSKEGETE